MASDPTVFIVDGDPVARDATSGLILKHGLNPETFTSAEEFLNQFDSSRPGCLLLELRLPGMDGLELQQELQRRNVSIPIIFATVSSDVLSESAGLTSGVVGILDKPFTKEKFLSLIRHAFELNRQIRIEKTQHG